VGRLVVFDGGRMAGYLSIKDVLHLLQLEVAGPDGAVREPETPRLDRAA
jgi:hypothetical protein